MLRLCANAQYCSLACPAPLISLVMSCSSIVLTQPHSLGARGTFWSEPCCICVFKKKKKMVIALLAVAAIIFQWRCCHRDVVRSISIDRSLERGLE